MRATRRPTRRWMMLVLSGLAGCATTGTPQQALYRDSAAGPPAPSTQRSLVFGPTDDQAFASRNDHRGDGRRPLYYGPGGHLYYEDGTPVQFKGVREQLQNLRAEEQINPVR